MSVTVADEGNRRKGDMTQDEVDQCVTDIKAWLQRSGLKCDENDQASTLDIQKLEKSIDLQIPQTLQSILKIANGGIYFFDKELLSTSQIAGIYSSMEDSKQWKASLLPFAGDESAMLVVDCSSKGGRVLEWDCDDGLGDVVDCGNTVASYIENYRNLILAGSCEFIKGCGVVEKMNSKARK